MPRMITDKPPAPGNAQMARRLLRAHRYGALSTLSKKFEGHPFGSITPYLTDQDGSLLILISGLAEHTKNILHDSRVSLITHNQGDPNIQAQGRVTVVGNASLDPERDRCAKRYLRYFPEAQQLLQLADFNFFRITPSAIRYIGGVGDVHWARIENYRVPIHPLMHQEEALIDEFNRDHRPGLARLSGRENTGEVRLIGIDCDGYDMRTEGTILRNEFATPVVDAAQARAALLSPGD